MTQGVSRTHENVQEISSVCLLMCVSLCVISAICKQVYPVKGLKYLCKHCTWLLHTHIPMIMCRKSWKKMIIERPVVNDELVEQLCALLKGKSHVYTFYKQAEGHSGFSYVLTLLGRQWQPIEEAMSSGCD